MPSLPTPPSTSHKDKENIAPPRPRRRGVEWSDDPQIHIFSPARTRERPAPVKARAPAKSILKPPRPPPSAAPETRREPTPPPDDVLHAPRYLARPVAALSAPGTPLRELTEAYAVLAARVRAACDAGGEAREDPALPLFRPLRDGADAVARAIVRDLARVLVDPLASGDGMDRDAPQDVEPDVSCLPSPKDSPKKKGMSEEQVKYARDVCAVTHSVLKFLVVAFTTPAVYLVFSREQLLSILTQVLAIPLEPSLPTPNSRKTYALAIALLQIQRLPFYTLARVKDKLTSALKRGIRGELGKEGKKGAGSDGLKAIHDLSIYQPVVFIPHFASILPSILDSLRGTLPIRLQAAHALGGFVQGLTSSEHPFPAVHRRASAFISDFLLTRSPSPKSPSFTANTSLSSPWIVQELKDALNNASPTHAALGPTWGLSVLSSFLVLLGPALLEDARLLKLGSSLLQTVMRQKKSSIRALTCAVFRPLIWVWVRWGADEGDEGDGDEAAAAAREATRGLYWKLMKSTLDCGIGVSLTGALLGASPAACAETDLKKMLAVLNGMTRRGGPQTSAAIDLLQRFLMPVTSTDFTPAAYDAFRARLLPPFLFSAVPGLLTTDWAVLCVAVKNGLEECPKPEDVRPLSEEELALPWLWDGLMVVWKECFGSLEIDDHETTPAVMIDTWEGLVRAKAQHLDGNDDALSIFANECCSVLIDVIKDDEIDLRRPPSSQPASRNNKSRHSLKSRKLSVVRDLWPVISTSFPPSSTVLAAETMLAYLAENEHDIVPRSDIESDTSNEWMKLCVRALKDCPPLRTCAFWRAPGDNSDWGWEMRKRTRVWRTYAQSWREEMAPWQGAAVILGLPFQNDHHWDMSDQDISEWDSLLQYTLTKGFENDHSSSDILETITENIDRRHLLTLDSSTQVADLLLSHLDLSATTPHDRPAVLLDLVHDILLASYPPQPSNKVVCLWLIRSLTKLIDNCPSNLLILLLEQMHDGICMWMTDECDAFSSDEYDRDMVALYQTILVSLQSLPPSVCILQSLSCIFSSPCCEQKTECLEALEAFKDFWENSCAELIEPEDGWSEGIAVILKCINHHYGTQYLQSSQSVQEEDPTEIGEEEIMLVDEEEYDADVSFDSCLGRSARAKDVAEESLEFPDSDSETWPIVPIRNGPRASSSKLVALSRPRAEETDVPGVELSNLTTSSTTPTTPRHPKTAHASKPPRPEKLRTTPLSPKSFCAQPASSPLVKVSARSARRRRRQTVSAELHASPKGEQSEKENASPNPVSTCLSYPKPTCTLGKKGALTTSKPPTRAAKKRRVADNPPAVVAKPKPVLADESRINTSSDTEDDRIVDASLPVVSDSPSDASSSNGTSSAFDDRKADNIKIPSLLGPYSYSPPDAPTYLSKKKRKRVFMDAVVLRTLKDVEKTRTSDILALSSPVVRYVYEPGLTQTSARSDCLLRSSERRKRQKLFHVDAFGNTERPFSFSKALFPNNDHHTASEPEMPESDDSFTALVNGRIPIAPQSSSDDDAPEGQITPYHLITPPLRRVVALERDPPSDDSMPSSPIRSHVARKTLRASSLSLTPYSPIGSTPVAGVK